MSEGKSWFGSLGRERDKRQFQSTYISVMVSGRFVGISVRPFPRQSTMLLLQVQAAGQCSTLQEGTINDWCPEKETNSNYIFSPQIQCCETCKLIPNNRAHQLTAIHFSKYLMVNGTVFLKHI